MSENSLRFAVLVLMTVAFAVFSCGETEGGTERSVIESSEDAPARTGASSTGSQLALVLDRGHVRVCTTGDYEPFTSYDPKTKEYEGLDIEMARGLADALGVEPCFVGTSWPTLMKDFTAGKCDIAMGGISVDLERQKQTFYSAPYLEDGKTPVTMREDAEKFRSLEQIDRPSVQVIVNPGGTNEEFVQERLDDAEIIVHENNVTIFDQIVEGKADLMITDSVEAVYQANLQPKLRAVHPDEPFTYSEKAYLLPRGDVEWKAWVDQWLHLTQKTGEFESIYDEWINASSRRKTG